VIVIGIDPGVRACGLAVLCREDGTSDPWRAWSANTVRTTTKEPLHERLRRLWTAILSGTGNHAETLVIAVEEQTGAAEGARRAGATNADALLVQQVVGLARAAAYMHSGATFVEVTPAEAKRVLNGMTMTASKAQVQRAIRSVVRDCPGMMSEHASDAVAIALAGARMARQPRAPFCTKRKRWRRR
jgi:Holliday junction resolvasome RuvABC endonuclease subunit